MNRERGSQIQKYFWRPATTHGMLCSKWDGENHWTGAFHKNNKMQIVRIFQFFLKKNKWFFRVIRLRKKAIFNSKQTNECPLVSLASLRILRVRCVIYSGRILHFSLCVLSIGKYATKRHRLQMSLTCQLLRSSASSSSAVQWRISGKANNNFVFSLSTLPATDGVFQFI